MTTNALLQKIFDEIHHAEQQGMTMPEIFGAICSVKSLYEVEFLTAFIKLSNSPEKKKETP